MGQSYNILKPFVLEAESSDWTNAADPFLISATNSMAFELASFETVTPQNYDYDSSSYDSQCRSGPQGLINKFDPVMDEVITFKAGKQNVYYIEELTTFSTYCQTTANNYIY